MAGHVEGDASLALGIVQNGVHFAKANHLPVCSEEWVLLDVGGSGIVLRHVGVNMLRGK